MKEKNKEHTNYIGVRVTDEEKEILQRVADRLKCSISEALRRCVRRKYGPPMSGISEADQKANLQMEARYVRLEFKKIATDYHNFVTLFVKRLSESNGLELSGAEYALGALQDLTMELQSTLNRFLEISKEGRIHKVVRNPGLKTLGESVKEDAKDILDRMMKIIYCNMEKITILGTVSGEVTVYPNRNNIEFMKFTVAVSSFRDAGKVTKYVVIKERSNIVPYLQNGRQVVVAGDLDVNPDGMELDIYASDIKLTSMKSASFG